jgi:hypothetical protein
MVGISPVYLKRDIARHWWLMPIILVIQEAEIRIVV